MNNAIDVAKYVINKCIDMENPISNLKLQKILYYLQGNFLAKFSEPAFDEEVIAWKHGPVIPEVYFEFNSYGSFDITEKYNNTIDFTDEEKNMINDVIEKKCKLGPWKLVSDTHNEKPWKENYKEGKNIVIPKTDIEEFFKKLEN